MDPGYRLAAIARHSVYRGPSDLVEGVLRWTAGTMARSGGDQAELGRVVVEAIERFYAENSPMQSGPWPDLIKALNEVLSVKALAEALDRVVPNKVP